MNCVLGTVRGVPIELMLQFQQRIQWSVWHSPNNTPLRDILIATQTDEYHSRRYQPLHLLKQEKSDN
jgi:hypothetical protein